jgi:hypothetical protein
MNVKEQEDEVRIACRLLVALCVLITSVVLCFVHRQLRHGVAKFGHQYLALSLLASTIEPAPIGGHA